MKGFDLGFPGFLREGLFFRIDAVSLAFVIPLCLVWFLSYLFSIPYMAHEKRHPSNHPLGPSVFYAAFGLSFLSTLLVFLSRDLFTLFFFFELLTIFSSFLVLYEGDKEAWEAFGLYLFMSLLGGLLVLFATMVLKSQTGSTAFSSLGLLDKPYASFVPYVLMAGFGVKAGAFGFHMWLPRAHPVAPAPCSAVLSGVMIKVGAYGILRVVLSLGGKDTKETLGLVLAFWGLANLFAGGLGALFSTNFKRVLAYSSVSQMGYILLGISAIPLSHAGPLALSGVLFHVTAHGLFKGLLFMEAGYFLMTRSTINLNGLKGALAGRRDILGVIGFTGGFLAIVGIPGLGGFISKTFIHDGLLLASHESWIWGLIEKGFLLGSFLTAVYFIRLAFILFAPGADRSRNDSFSLFHPLKGRDAILVGVAFALAIVFLTWLGMNPHFWIKRVVLSALPSLPEVLHDNEGHALFEAVHELENFHFFELELMKPVFIGLLVGLAANLVFRKYLGPKDSEGKDNLVDMLSWFGKATCRLVGHISDDSSEKVFKGLGFVSKYVFIPICASIETCCQKTYQFSVQSLGFLSSLSGWVERWAGFSWRLLAKIIGIEIPRFAQVIEEEDQVAFEVMGKGTERLVYEIDKEERAVAKSYEKAALEANKVTQGMASLERFTEDEYSKGGKVFRDVVQKGGKGALRLRPDFLLKGFGEKVAFLSKASLVLIGLTIILTLGVALVLLVI